jgi:curved DNA-binding protein CbpA
MKNRRNFYRILHVQPDAPTAVIRASYRTIMQRLKIHPDLGGDHEQAVSINEAFATLSDPVRRAEYDRVLKQSDRERKRRAPPVPTPPPEKTAASSSQGVSCAFCQAPCSSADIGRPDGECSACGSPLFPARKHDDGEASRRAIGRVPRNMPVTFWLPASGRSRGAALTEDISLNGTRLLSRTEIPVGARVRLECDFCSAVGVVRSSHADSSISGARWQCGVEFLTLRVKRERGGLFSTVG